MQVSKINYTNNKTTFTSYNNPIKSFDIPSPKGMLHFYEINSKHQAKNSFCKALAEFFLENFATTSSHPYWKLLISDKKTDLFYDRVKDDAKRYKKFLKSKDSTVLVAKDKAKHIVAAIFTKSLNETPTVKDADTLYIDSIAVNPEYRGKGIGETLINKILSSAAERFSDVFLVAYKESVPFYKKLGFQTLDYYKKPNAQYLISELAKDRLDYPEYAEFMEKPLLKECPIDWCSRIEYRNIPKW